MTRPNPNSRLAARRWVAALAVVLFGLAVLWVVGQRRVAGMQAEMTDRSMALLGPWRRPGSTSAERTGSALDAMLGIYPAFVDELAAWDDARAEPVFARCAAVRDGVWPLADLPTPCRVMIQRVDAELAALADLAAYPRFGAPGDWNDLKFWPIARAATAGALAARMALEERDDPAAALGRCIGMLELWKNLSHVTTLQGGSNAAVVVERFSPVCADALRHADIPTRVRAARRLAALLANLAPISQAIDREALLGEVTMFGPRLPRGLPRTLHPYAWRRATTARVEGAAAGASTEPIWLAPWVLVPQWREYREVMAAIASAADGPPEQSIPAVRAIITDAGLSDLARVAASARWPHHLRAQHRARERVRALYALATSRR